MPAHSHHMLCHAAYTIGEGLREGERAVAVSGPSDDE